jgi:hypothetical protein
LADVINERAPSCIPFVLHNLDENTVALGEDVLQSLREVLNGRVLKDQIDDVVFE